MVNNMDTNKILKSVADALEKVAREKRDKQMKEDRQDLVNSINATLGPLLIPYLSQMVQNSKMHKGEMMEMMAVVMSDLRKGIKEALTGLKLDNIKADVKIPEIKIPNFPDIKVPEPRVIVNFDTSKIQIAPPVMPKEMVVSGEVKLKGVDMDHPLPVQLRDADGKPMKLFENLTTLIGGGSGNGKTDFFTIKDIKGSSASLIDQVEGALKVTGNFSVSAAGASMVSLVNADGTYYNSDNPLPITGTLSTSPAPQVSGYADSVNVMQIAGTNIAAGSGVDGAGVQRVVHVVDVVTSVNVVNFGDGVAVKQGQGDGASATGMLNGLPMMVNESGTHDRMRNFAGEGGALRVQMATDAVASVYVTGSSGSLAATILNGDGTARDSWLVSDITNSIKAALVDSGGVQYSGSNPVPVTVAGATTSLAVVNIDRDGNPQQVWTLGAGSAAIGSVNVNGTLNSMVAVGDLASDAADTGSSPIKIGGIARTANPTAVAAGDRVSATYDDLGRAVTRPVQVRDLTSTAYATLTNGTETTLFAGATSTYHDLIYVLASNNSTAAVGVDIRATVGGNIMLHLEIPANSTVGVATPVPIPAGDVGATWTADMSDITGTTVYLSALFSKEV